MPKLVNSPYMQFNKVHLEELAGLHEAVQRLWQSVLSLLYGAPMLL